MNLINELKIFLRIDKILDSLTKRKEAEQKRNDIEQIRHYKTLSADLKMMGLNKSAQVSEERARIIEETSENTKKNL
jgi:hypothetical protein